MEHILVADVGGTYTRIGIAELNKKIKLKFYFNFKSKKLKSLLSVINFMLSLAKAKHLNITKACIAGAGSVKNGNIRLTNVKWNINKKEILKKTSLKQLKIINDFEAIGYWVKTNSSLIIGPGTGLGIAMIKNNKVIATEKGHTKFDIKDEFDKLLAKKMKIKEYEDVLSGKGLEKIYKLLTKKSKKAEEISKQIDSKSTFRLFAKYFARLINKLAKEEKLSNVYIAGGIAMKNRKLIKYITPDLDNLNVYIIPNPNAGLLGAAITS